MERIGLFATTEANFRDSIGWCRADPIAGLVIVYYGFREGATRATRVESDTS